MCWRGISSSTADPQVIRDLFDLRIGVEPAAAAAAAERRSANDLARLAESLSRMARSSPFSALWLTAAVDFHHALLTASGNSAFIALWPVIEATLYWSNQLQTDLGSLELVHDPVADHARVYDSVASRSAGGAREAMARLADASRQDALRQLELKQPRVEGKAAAADGIAALLG